MQRITYTQGNTFSVAIPMVRKTIDKNGSVTTITTENFTPSEGDVVEVRLIGQRRTYTYTPRIEGNIAVVDMQGNELAGHYGIEVVVVTANGERMRFADPHALELVPFTGEVDNFVVGSVELEASVFFAMSGPKGDKGDKGDRGDDGNGIVSIVKTGTSGLVDTYTISYTDGTTSTFNVTNGADGQQGAQGEQGVSITSIVQTTTSTASGGENIITVTLSNGAQSTFSIYNGQQAPLDNDVSANSPNAVKSSGIYTAIHNAMPFLVTVTWDSVSEHYTNTDLTIADLEAAYNRGQKITLNFVGGDVNGAQLDLFGKSQDMYVFAGIVGTKSQLALVTGGATDTISVDISATEIDPNVPYIMEAGPNPSLGLNSNTFYKFNDPITSLTIVGLNGVASVNVLNVYAFSFTAGVDNPTITLPQGVVINQDLSLKTGDVCEFSIQDNLALFSVWEAS